MASMKQKEIQEEKLLRSATAWQRKIPKGPQPISGFLDAYIKTNLDGLKKGITIAAAFETAVGSRMSALYRVEQATRGTLIVSAPPGPYMHQLKMMETEILNKINALCPKAKLRTIHCKVSKARRNNNPW